MGTQKPTVNQILSAPHLSYANALAEDEGGFCAECQSKIPDAAIGRVNKSTFYVLSQDGEIVLLNPARITKRNVDAIETRLMALGAGYCVDCRTPHPLSAMAKAEDEEVTTENVLAPLL